MHLEHLEEFSTLIISVNICHNIVFRPLSSFNAASKVQIFGAEGAENLKNRGFKAILAILENSGNFSQKIACIKSTNFENFRKFSCIKSAKNLGGPPKFISDS